MPTYSALYYHFIWSTKNRAPLIPMSLETKMHAYINGIVKSKGGTVLQVGGMPDHIHLLVRLKPDQSVPELIKIIKTTSGKWLKEADSSLGDFYWQKGYGAFSVSKSQTDSVQEYIMNQHEHHKYRSFKDEWLAFLQKHGVEYDEKFVFE